MSINLGTRSASVVNGRCTGCGRFISRNESHFHSPPRKFRGRPVAHLFNRGGGIVTRCEDPVQARVLLVRKYVADGDDWQGQPAYPLDQARIERGRFIVTPHSWDGSSAWIRLPDDARGPGVTTAVVWNP